MTIATGQPLLASDINNLTFFPKGAILTFSSTAWSATSAEFKNIWKICNKANHDTDPNVPDLSNRFLRGGASSDFTTGGGADSQSVILNSTNLPVHTHGTTNLSVSNLNTSGLSIISSGGHTHSGSGSTGATGSGGHTHTVSGSTNSTSRDLTGNIYFGEHSVTASGIVSAVPSNQPGPNNGDGDNCYFHFDVTHSHNITGSTGTGEGGHSHDVSVTIPESGSHSHAVTGSITGGSVGGTLGSAGEGKAFSVNTVPAYYTVIYIIKVA